MFHGKLSIQFPLFWGFHARLFGGYDRAKLHTRQCSHASARAKLAQSSLLADLPGQRLAAYLGGSSQQHGLFPSEIVI